MTFMRTLRDRFHKRTASDGPGTYRSRTATSFGPAVPAGRHVVADRPVLVDLFCGAGGAAMGYHRAGFDVVGVDILPQPHYPFRFVQADAMTYPLDGFDAIHASPPCQDHAPLKVKHDAVTMRGWWFVLCGSSFGLDVRRHRRFRSNVLLLPPTCDHVRQTPRFRSLDKRREGKLASVVGVHGHINYAGEAEIRNRAMDIDWMTQHELAQAIPPAYTEWIGREIISGFADQWGTFDV